MSAEQIAVVTGVIVALVQFSKWAGIPDQRGPVVVLALSALGVVVWGVSFEPSFDRRLIWTYLAAWIVVATSSAGVYGFTRAMPSAITSTKKPPAGAAQAPTEKMR